MNGFLSIVNQAMSAVIFESQELGLADVPRKVVATKLGNLAVSARMQDALELPPAVTVATLASERPVQGSDMDVSTCLKLLQGAAVVNKGQDAPPERQAHFDAAFAPRSGVRVQTRMSPACTHPAALAGRVCAPVQRRKVRGKSLNSTLRGLQGRFCDGRVIRGVSWYLFLQLLQRSDEAGVIAQDMVQAVHDGAMPWQEVSALVEQMLQYPLQQFARVLLTVRNDVAHRVAFSDDVAPSCVMQCAVGGLAMLGIFRSCCGSRGRFYQWQHNTLEELRIWLQAQQISAGIQAAQRAAAHGERAAKRP
jgi:hypothetical protein